MADQIDPNIFYSDVKAGKQTMGPKSGGDQIDPSIFYEPEKQAAAPSEPKGDTEYERQIKSKLPEAREIAKSLGTFGAVEAGIKDIPILGPVVSEVGTSIGAAFPESAGFATGKTFGERRQDIKAQHEALSRAIEEQHPYVKGASELAGSLALPVGGVTKIVGAGAEAAGAAPVVGRLLGYGTEAGAYGAGTAAAEKYLGTKPESETPDIGKSALVGAGLGLGFGGLGETIGAGVRKFAPDWMKGVAASGDAATDSLMQAFQKDAKAGKLAMPLDEFVRMSRAGQPVVLADVGGPEFQKMLAKISRRNPEAMTDLIEQLQDRVMGATDRFEDFATRLAGRDLNAATLAKEAEEAAIARNKAAWEPIKNPSLGRGTWLPQWTPLLREPVFQQALKNADKNLGDAIGPGFVSPTKSSLEQSIGAIPSLSDRVRAILEDNGIKTMRDLQTVKKADLLEMLQVSPTSGTTASKNIAGQQTRSLVDEVLGAQNQIPKEQLQISPQRVNMQYIDQVRRELAALKDEAFRSPAGTTGGVGRKAESITDRFMSPLRDPNSKYYSPELDRAIRQSQTIFGEKDAAKAGLNFLSKDRNALAQQNIAEAVKTMTADERKLFRQNVLIDLLQRSRKSDGSGALDMRVINRTFAPGSTTAQALETAFGTANYRNLERFVKVEGAFRDSLTRLAKARGQQDPTLYERLRELRIVPTWLMSPTAATAQFMYGLLSQHFEKKYAQKLAEKFASPDIAQFQQAMNAINNNPPALSSIMTGILRGATMGVSQMSQSSAPRIERADGGGVDDYQSDEIAERADISPKKTVKAYKLFRIDPRKPNQLFPLFVDAEKPVPMHQWVKAESGPTGKNPTKVKSKLGDLAYRPGWHAGDLPIATHIGGKSDPSLKAPDYRPDNHVWAEIQMPDDVDWQSVANSRAEYTKKGKIKPVTAHITDQVPYGGHYRYKTNSNMTGNWLIGGEMKVNRILSDEEVKAINDAHGVADLPRIPKEYIEHGDERREKNLKDFQGRTSRAIKEPKWYHGTGGDFSTFNKGLADAIYLTRDPEFANKFTDKTYLENYSPNIMPVHVRAEKPFDYQNKRHMDNLIKELGPDLIMDPSLHEFVDDVRKGDWGTIESPPIQGAIRALGHDSFYVSEGGNKNLAVYHPNQIKSSTGNSGNFDPLDSDITKNKGGRIERATGGRIPNIDKAFKVAKRELDGETKPILNMHDDDVVKALRIMQGRV